VRNGDLEKAKKLIRRAEADLRYKLTEGQCGDLLADNFNHWPLDYIRHVLADLQTWRALHGLPLRKKQTHRELQYDPRHSTRKFKRFMRMTTSGGAAEEAWGMGQASVEGDMPKRWRTNPYRPGGRRWKLYEDGRESAMKDIEEARAHRRWNGG
jgi:hypothetical protein